MSYKMLIKGYDFFKKKFFENTHNKLYQELTVNGQHPDTLIIACSDSRIDPAILTHSAPGDFFAIRNVSALVPPYRTPHDLHGTSSAIEYAVKGLEVSHIIVLGHSQCGGMDALLKQDNIKDFEYLSHWLSIAEQARDQVINNTPFLSFSDKSKVLEQAAILTSLNNLLTFPWVKERHLQSKIQLHGWYFDMQGQALLEYDHEDGSFRETLNDGQYVPMSNEINISKFIQQYK